MLESIIKLDSSLSTFIANLFPHTNFFNQFFSLLSLSGLTFIVGVMLTIIFLINKKHPYKEFALYFLLSFFTTYVVVNIFIKNFVQRDRPYITQNVSAATCPDDFSFPSGHASTAFAGAVVFTAFDKKRRWWYYGLAFLIALSRIYLLCHYFLDVVFGALIGFEIGRSILVYLPYNRKK